MANNLIFKRAQLRVTASHPTTPLSGQPLRVGGLTGVALNDEEVGGNVIDVACEQASILEGLRKALDPDFRVGLRGLANPYSSGKASEKIVEVLKRTELGDRLVMKRFYDIKAVSAEEKS